jgi:large subunit ribosomal protein L25
MTINIKAEKREKIGKLESLRKAGFLPAVYYGHKKEATPIQIKKNDFLKAWREAGESTVISLKTDNGDLEALIHDVDIDPVSSEPRHADFYVFEKGHKVEIAVDSPASLQAFKKSFFFICIGVASFLCP